MKMLLIAACALFSVQVSAETFEVESQPLIAKKDMRAPVHPDEPGYRPSNHYGRSYNWRDFAGKPKYSHRRDLASAGEGKKSGRKKSFNPYVKKNKKKKSN